MYNSAVLAENVTSNVALADKEYLGGRTQLVVIGTLAGTTKLQQKGPDNVTYVDVVTIAAAGVQLLDLPHGVYRLSQAGIAGAGVYARLTQVVY